MLALLTWVTVTDTIHWRNLLPANYASIVLIIGSRTVFSVLRSPNQ